MKTTIDSIIDDAKFRLGLRDTTYPDVDLERFINEGARHLDATDSYVINCVNLELDCEKVKLPDERAGTLMVIRPFERISYALVMEAKRDLRIYDSVKNP